MQVYGGGEFPAYVIDEDTLREELLSEEDTREWLEETPEDPHTVAFWRMLGELDRALQVGERALAAQEPFTPGWAAAAVRLAQVLHWRGDHEDAHELLDVAEEVLTREGQDPRAQGRLLAYARQHRAKALFDEGRLEEAEDQAAAALRLRQQLGEPQGLLASSQQTVDRIARERAARAV